MILTHLEPLDKGGSFSMSRKIFHKSLHNSCPFFQIATGDGVGYNSGTREALIKSARAVSERFFVQSRYRRRRNTVCISRFRYRRVGEKDPLIAADDLFRGFLKRIESAECPDRSPSPRNCSRSSGGFSMEKTLIRFSGWQSPPPLRRSSGR